MKAVLASLKPYYYYLVGEGIKKIEARKTYPKADDWNRETYFYMSKDKQSFARIPKEYQDKYRKHFGKVGLKWKCSEIEPLTDYDLLYGLDEISNSDIEEQSCVDIDELLRYKGKNDFLYAWHISDLVIYDEPKLLSEFTMIDVEAVKQCKDRERVYTDPIYTNNAFLLGGYICNKGETDWCSKCKTKLLTRPPQSWCYVEEKE